MCTYTLRTLRTHQLTTVSTTNFMCLKTCVKRKHGSVKNKKSKRRTVGICSNQGRQWRWSWNDRLLYSSLVKSATTKEQECFWPRFWSHHNRANGTVASYEKAFSAGGANIRWNSTMVLNDPKITAIQPFSSASSSSVNTFRQATNIFASCSCSFIRIRVGPWLARSAEQWPYLFFTSIVEYCCSGT